MVFYSVAKKMKGETEIFTFQLLTDLLVQEMSCIIDVNDIMEFVTMQEISANCNVVYMK